MYLNRRLHVDTVDRRAQWSYQSESEDPFFETRNDAIESIKFDKMLCNDVLVNKDDLFNIYWSKLDRKVEKEISQI